jgi:hypothetical protein
MKTDELIALLARNPAPPPRRAGLPLLAVAGGSLVSLVLVLALLRPRADLALAVQGGFFWGKLLFVCSLAAIGAWAARQLSAPGRFASAAPALLLLAMLAMGLPAATDLLGAPDVQTRSALWLGKTWRVCPWLISVLSLPILAGWIWVLKQRAVVAPRLAGGAAGLAAGGMSAALYSLHCPESSAAFVATWYALGIALPALAGWLAGWRLLRW